jgi:hypothetical protein
MKVNENMPKGDKTGPEGLGPRSGRGLGYCSGYNSPGYNKGIPQGGRGYNRRYEGEFGRGFGRGFGWGRGRRYHLLPEDLYYPHRNPIYASESNIEMNKEEEKHYLEKVVQNLENELKNIKNRLKELANNNKNDTP